MTTQIPQPSPTALYLRNGLPIPAKPVVLVTAADEDTRRMLCIGLRTSEFEVAEARGFEESIEFAETRRPSVILMDAVLPFGENLKAIDRLHNSDAARDVPVILLSGFSQEQFIKAAMEHGARGFLVKPVDWEQLEGCITAAVIEQMV
jgi:DNA-binding response OmpR family regulator